MTSKERVLITLARKTADRVPINYDANAGIDRRLKEHFGLKPDDHEALREMLGVDFRGVGAPYVGPQLHADIPDRGVKVDNWGIHRRWIEHERGGYCRDILDIMMPGGGYCFSPTGNVVAMYETARKYGTY